MKLSELYLSMPHQIPFQAVQLISTHAPTNTAQCLVFQPKRLCSFQGHPMDLFLKISVLQAHFCWLGDVEEIIVLGKKVLLGKR